MNTVDELEEDYVFSTSHGMKEVSPMTINIDDQLIQVMVDTGASINFLTWAEIRKLKGLKTSRTSRRLMPYGTDAPLALHGELVATTKANNREVQS